MEIELIVRCTVTDEATLIENQRSLLRQKGKSPGHVERAVDTAESALKRIVAPMPIGPGYVVEETRVARDIQIGVTAAMERAGTAIFDSRAPFELGIDAAAIYRAMEHVRRHDEAVAVLRSEALEQDARRPA